MSSKQRPGTQSKSRQSRAPCLCGCKATSPTTIAAHRKALERRARLDSLSSARFVSNHPQLSASCLISSKHLSQRQPTDPVQSAEEATCATDDLMDVDPPASGPRPSETSSTLARVWANRAKRPEREDEDLLSEPGSPEPSENGEDVESEGRGNIDEHEFLSDDEGTYRDEGTPVHAEISVRSQLTTNIQLHAARAGAFLNMVALLEYFLRSF